MVKKVYGLRVCRSCRGICHRGSWRLKYGIRKMYFCSKSCLRKYLEKRIKQKLPKSMRRRFYLSDKDFQYLLRDYERVDVITK